MILYILKKVGILSWFVICLYFLVEFFFILILIVFYSFLYYVMSDFGVIFCGIYIYLIVFYDICFFYYFWMNVLFIINGLIFLIGILYIL